MDPLESPLLTDLYQLTMLQGYYDNAMEQTATFEFFARKLPEGRNFLLAAGQQQVLEFVENARFRDSELEWLRSTGRFSDAFVDYLAGWRFTGDIYGMAEGTVCFPDEPMLRVSAPLPQAQLLESRVINLMHVNTLIASKAARAVLAAPGKLLVDFGMRRAHGGEAALAAARASYIAGFASTSTVLAGMLWDIPIAGTVAHSFIEAHDSERLAFENYARSQPGNVILLIDTYDTEAGAHKAVETARRLAPDGISVKAVRLDSGDLAAHAEKVRRILDAAGLHAVRIFSSGDLDEYRLRDLINRNVPIDGFGIGTRMDTSADRPYLDCAYKLMEYAGRGRRKRSEGKATWPGRKQVFRHYGEAGHLSRDVVTLHDDPQEGEPLLRRLMHKGRTSAPPRPLSAVRDYVREQYERLPTRLRSLEPAAPLPVEIAPALHRLAAETDRYIDEQEQR